jgi:4-diphosphocytidyl-2-C-methyl-D-erythritol kinase
VSPLRTLAPGKVNLCLYLGGRREDGLHELVSLVQAVSLADRVTLATAGEADGDAVLCPDVEGENLAERALRVYREAAGWDAPAQRLEIDKRVPVAAGMGGGSSDAAATLRLAAHSAGHPGDPRAAAVAPGLGADVPALLEPGLVLVGGAGERVQRLAPLAPFGVLVVPARERLATADVYREAERMGLARPEEELTLRRNALVEAIRPGGPLPAELIGNDLEPAARALCPAIDDALVAAGETGAERTLVSGSGPTVVGLFSGEGGLERARAAAQRLAGQFRGACAAHPVDARYAEVEERQ